MKVFVTGILPHANQVSLLTLHLRVSFQCYTKYTEATEGSPRVGGDDDTRGFPLSTILFPSCPSGLHQEAKTFLATRGQRT